MVDSSISSISSILPASFTLAILALALGGLAGGLFWAYRLYRYLYRYLYMLMLYKQEQEQEQDKYSSPYESDTQQQLHALAPHAHKPLRASKRRTLTSSEQARHIFEEAHNDWLYGSPPRME